jgi:hypothetical protein
MQNNKTAKTKKHCIYHLRSAAQGQEVPARMQVLQQALAQSVDKSDSIHSGHAHAPVRLELELLRLGQGQPTHALQHSRTALAQTSSSPDMEHLSPLLM